MIYQVKYILLKAVTKKRVIGWVVGFIGCWICWILCNRAL